MDNYYPARVRFDIKEKDGKKYFSLDPIKGLDFISGIPHGDIDRKGNTFRPSELEDKLINVPTQQNDPEIIYKIKEYYSHRNYNIL